MCGLDWSTGPVGFGGKKECIQSSEQHETNKKWTAFWLMKRYHRTHFYLHPLKQFHDSSCLSGRTQLLGMRGWQVVLIGRTERQNHGSAYMLATWRLPVLTSFNVTSSIMIRINPNSTLQVRTDTKTLFSVFGTNTSGHSIGIRHTSARAPFCNLLLQNTIFFSVYILQ
jgi:hypothetical protein